MEILNNCRSIKFKTIFSLVYASGLRVSELQNLTISDLNFERKQIFIQRSKYQKDRYSVLGDNAIKLLKKYLRIYNPRHYLFYQKASIDKPLSRETVYKEFKKVLAISGLSIKHVHLHTLRHCFATHLVENGTSVFHVMHLLGHTSIHTTMLYLHMRAPHKLHITSPIDLIELHSLPEETSDQILLFPISA